MSGLNVVALISGGKDSLFSILHCHANGHKVIALANLHPKHNDSGAVDDLESYMYQTVGHAVIPLYEQALGLPVYRQEILGDAVNRDKSYGLRSPEDETESLLPLLRKVMAAHPDVNAVSTGAILSDYQRTRVESVAFRLGLTPLSYLWQWPSLPPGTQTSLLEDMAAVRQDSRIIKVASGGLDDSFLWSNVADNHTIARLSRAAHRFGSGEDGAVLGEGGEFETLAICGPKPLWKGRISISPSNVQTVLGEGGSASVRLAQPSVVMENDASRAEAEVRKPPLLDDRFQDMYDNLLSPAPSNPATLDPSLEFDAPTQPPAASEGTCVELSNVVGDGADAASQAESIMERIAASLENAGHSFDDVAYTAIILRDMNLFGAVNGIYGRYFVNPNPPARLTIACAGMLPSDALLCISIISILGPKQGLHVQSRSYWAPANIGPYSQAIAFSNDATVPVFVRGSVYIAGQIPLIPASMKLPSSSSSDNRNFALQSALALQHLARIGKAMMVRQWAYGMAFLARSTQDAMSPQQKEATVRRAWQIFHEPPAAVDGDADDENEHFDVWNQTHGSGSQPWRVAQTETNEEWASQKEVPQLTILEVDSLPRGSAIEWIGYGKTTMEDDALYPLHLRSLLDKFRRA